MIAEFSLCGEYFCMGMDSRCVSNELDIQTDALTKD